MNQNDPKIRALELQVADLQQRLKNFTTGQGAPNFTPQGRAIYIRQDGGVNSTLYVYEGSAWSPK
jgi:hypothetical protein